MKMPKTSSAKYYQENKEKLQKKARERFQNFFKEEKDKCNNMVMSITKISQAMKNVSSVSIEKNIVESEKMLYYNCEKHLL